MSVRVMSWVWDHSRSKSTQRLVLLAIADCAADDGANAYPSMAELMRKTGLSERGVQSAVNGLVELGELKVARNAGPRGCNRYRVRMTPARDAPPQNVPPADPAVDRSEESPQVEAETPADPAPPQEMHPPQEVHHPPAGGAPGTVLEPSEVKNVKPSSSPSAPKAQRGTRLPDDFAVTPEMLAWASERVPDVDERHETEKFVNYWQAIPGAKGRKLNWAATWRNWMLNATERSGGSGANGRPGSALAAANGRASPPRESTTDRAVNQALMLAAKYAEEDTP